MKKSNCTNYYDVEEQNNDNLECYMRELEAKQCRLNEIVLEKEELQRQLNNAAAYIEDTIKKHKALSCQLTNNYDELWAKYQNKCVELNEIKNQNECLNSKVDELNKKNEELGCQLNKQIERNEWLEDENCKLEKCSNVDKQNITCLRGQLESQKKCLEKSVEELNRTLHELDERTGELNCEKQKNFKLKSNIECLRDELSRTVEKCKLEAFQLNHTIECLKTTIEMHKRTNAELERALCDEKNQHREVIEALDKMERKNEMLKQTIEKERERCNEQLCRLQQEKAEVERERDELMKCAERRKDELRKMTCKNEQLQSHADELQCNLDNVTRENDEKFKTWSNKIEKARCENRQLKNELNCKGQKIIELEDRLSEAKKARMAEVESIHSLKIQLENLKCRLNASTAAGKCLPVDSNCQVTVKQDNCKLNCENLTATYFKFDDCSDDSDQKNGVYEKLISKCNTIINNYYTA